MFDVPPVILTDVAHQWGLLTPVLHAHELDEVRRVVPALGRLPRLLGERHVLVARQRARGVRRARARGAQVRAARHAVQHSSVHLILVTRRGELRAKRTDSIDDSES